MELNFLDRDLATSAAENNAGQKGISEAVKSKTAPEPISILMDWERRRKLFASDPLDLQLDNGAGAAEDSSANAAGNPDHAANETVTYSWTQPALFWMVAAGLGISSAAFHRRRLRKQRR